MSDHDHDAPDKRHANAGKRPSTPASGRVPLQARGHERRRLILDAAASIVREASVDALTMHLVAARAQTSVGSMYHFFRDREELLEALLDRHYDNLDALSEGSARLPDAQWVAMPAVDVIQHLFGQTISYLARHPDALATLKMRRDSRLDSFLKRVEHVMELRLGKDEVKKATSALFAAAAGTIFFIRDQEGPEHLHAISEIPILLTAYLERLESSRTAATTTKP